MNAHSREDVARQLAAREPIFHRPEFGRSRREFEAMLDTDFWEVGASGRKYSREFVLDVLDQRHQSPVVEQFAITDFDCRRVGDDVYLVTYRLEQAGSRLSRRSTLWRQSADGWKALYHQGTLISSGAA